MPEAARPHDLPEPVVSLRPLQLVPDRHDEIALAQPNWGRGGAVGYLIGFFAATVIITTIGTVGGLGFAPSFGLGAFIGVWGGGGFGFMLGATIPLARHMDAEAAHSTNHRQGDLDSTTAG
jgi:hypothetical protein